MPKGRMNFFCMPMIRSTCKSAALVPLMLRVGAIVTVLVSPSLLMTPCKRVLDRCQQRRGLLFVIGYHAYWLRIR